MCVGIPFLSQCICSLSVHVIEIHPSLPTLHMASASGVYRFGRTSALPVLDGVHLISMMTLRSWE